MATVKESFNPPFRNALISQNGLLSDLWERFVRSLYERVAPLGVENSFTILNNQSTAQEIPDLKFSKKGVSQAFVDYLVQRVTTGGSAVELIESGTMRFTYKPTSDVWDFGMAFSGGPDVSGVTFSISTDGQVKYESSNITGTAYISKLYWRARTISGKNQLYSSVGAR